MTEIVYTKIPRQYTEEGEEIYNVITCPCGFKTYDEYPNICPQCGITVNYTPSE